MDGGEPRRLSAMTFTLAILGRPNVGKSTLFNKLVGQRLALVDNQPGVTRDYREGEARLGSLGFVAIDTAGFDSATVDDLSADIRKVTKQALDMSNACLFVVDAKSGIIPADREIADFLRKQSKPVLVAANKSDGRAAELGYQEAFELGLGDPVRLSAEHGDGFGELYEQINRIAFDAGFDIETDKGESDGESGINPSAPMKIAVVGRPNSGKSSLINRVLGRERLLTGETPGITRDSISISAEWRGTKVRLFDTAGMRKRSRVVEKIEKLSVSDGLRAVRFAEVVVVLVDAAIPFESQDLRIADLTEREGRAMVVAINKWDLVEEKRLRLRELKQDFELLLPQMKGAPVVAVSALTGAGLARLHAAVQESYENWNRRVSTGILNRWLEEMVIAHPPPAPRGRRIKLRYVTQSNSRPPTFIVMCSHPRLLPESYSRYLVNGLRSRFGLLGTPIRLIFRSRAEKNPFATNQ